MPTRPKRSMRHLLAVSGVALLVLGFVTPVTESATPQAHANSYEPITGTGSTWSQNALDQWRRNVASNYGMTVNYSGVGSSAGRRDFINGSVDFAVSEIPFQSRPEDGSAPEIPPRGYAYMPIVAGGTAFMYNLKISGKRVTNLRLSGETITKIFTGGITNWNDPQIQADNPGLAMPDKAIVPIYRSDGSGSTAQFTLWMSKQYPSLWSSFCSSVGRPSPCGLTSQYPQFGNAKGQNGSAGVAGYVAQDYGEGAITYVEYSYAIEAGFPIAKVLNAAGYYIEPTAEAVAVALLQAQINQDPNSADYLTQILDGVYNNADARTYPLSSYSYMIVPTQVGGVFTQAKGNSLGVFGNYMLCEGQQQAKSLGYSPLPMNLVLAGFEQIKRIPGAGSVSVDPNNCNNPTFKPGDSPSNNQLALTAPMPADCDRVGQNQCTTGTGGAAGIETPISGSGAGGSATGGNGNLTAGAGGAGAAVYDEYGNLISGAGGAVGGATSSPFTLATGGWGGAQTLMLAAAILLIAAMVVPPVLWTRIKRRGAPSEAAS